MAGTMALKVNGYRQAGNMRWCNLSMYRQSGGCATKTQWPDTQLVDASQDFLLKLSNFCTGVGFR